MGTHVTRTAVEELAEARAKLDAAFAEMRNWHAHLETMAERPLESEAVAHQARRSARIVAALIAEAESGTRVAARLQARRWPLRVRDSGGVEWMQEIPAVWSAPGHTNRSSAALQPWNCTVLEWIDPDTGEREVS